MINKLKYALLNRKKTIGAWIQIGHPNIAEIFAKAGFDWICVDLEHAPINIETMTNIFRTIDAFDSIPVARIPFNDPVWIHRTIDSGAKGIIIPMIKTAQEAKNAVSETKYPPKGNRGFGYSRANMYGIDFEKYIKTANDEISIIIQIEHIDAINNLEEISKITEIDGFFIGPLDLSGSMGITGQMKHQNMINAIKKYRKILTNAKKSFGTHVIKPNKKNINQAIKQGNTLIATGTDNVFLYEMSKNILNLTK